MEELLQRFNDRVQDLKSCLFIPSTHQSNSKLISNYEKTLHDNISDLERRLLSMSQWIQTERELLETKGSDLKLIVTQQQQVLERMTKYMPKYLPGQSQSSSLSSSSSSSSLSTQKINDSEEKQEYEGGDNLDKENQVPANRNNNTLNNSSNSSSKRPFKLNPELPLTPPHRRGQNQPLQYQQYQQQTQLQPKTQPLKSKKSIYPSSSSSIPSSNNNNNNSIVPSDDIPSIDYLTLEELHTIPSYLLGRFKLDKINTAIRELNVLFTDKYTLLQYQPSKMTKKQRDRYWNYRESINEESKGKWYITEKDIKENWPNCQFRLDPIGRAVISILRHMGRMKEVRGGGHLRFVLVQ